MIVDALGGVPVVTAEMRSPSTTMTASVMTRPPGAITRPALIAVVWAAAGTATSTATNSAAAFHRRGAGLNAVMRRTLLVLPEIVSRCREPGARARSRARTVQS